MSEKEILEKAINIAIGNNLTVSGHKVFSAKVYGWYVKLEIDPELVDPMRRFTEISIPELIFDHSFAKALWGDWDMVESGNLYTVGSNKVERITHFEGKIWQYHLQQLVIADDRLKYLREHI